MIRDVIRDESRSGGQATDWIGSFYGYACFKLYRLDQFRILFKSDHSTRIRLREDSEMTREEGSS